ncbi:hypothetical protein LJC21_03540, partial [Bacteroides sp. OttesenSCG-928-E20]|nr:hypothetical protein [Bacteroides sp. OttesenSCG-928-E20]
MSVEPLKRFLLFAFFLCFQYLVFAQTDVSATIKDYLVDVGEYSVLYNGELEEGYSASFLNLPYYETSDYVQGDIVFKGCMYSQQKLRLDLYKERLIILTGQKRYNVIVNPLGVDKVFLHGETIIWHSPNKASNLKDGYYSQLFEGTDLQLLKKTKFATNTMKEKEMRYFSQQTRYYLLYKDVYYQVKNKRSVIKAFPELKQEINKFVKEHSLNFKRDT